MPRRRTSETGPAEDPAARYRALASGAWIDPRLYALGEEVDASAAKAAAAIHAEARRLESLKLSIPARMRRLERWLDSRGELNAALTYAERGAQ